MEKIFLKKKDCGIHWGERSGPCSKCKHPLRIRDLKTLAWYNSCERTKKDTRYYERYYKHLKQNNK